MYRTDFEIAWGRLLGVKHPTTRNHDAKECHQSFVTRAFRPRFPHGRRGGKISRAASLYRNIRLPLGPVDRVIWTSGFGPVIL